MNERERQLYQLCQRAHVHLARWQKNGLMLPGAVDLWQNDWQAFCQEQKRHAEQLSLWNSDRKEE